METLKGKIILTFDGQVASEKDGPIEGFSISGKDRRFQPANTEQLIIKKDTRNKPVYDFKKVVPSSRYVSEPIHYRYAWGRNPMGNIKHRLKSDSSILAT